MSIFKGVAIATPMKENLKLILTSWMRCWKSRSLAELMRSSSAERPENPLP